MEPVPQLSWVRMIGNPLAAPLLRHLAVGIALGEAARGVREESPNWGEDIRAYLAACDPPIKVPAPYCAAFVQACTDKAARQAGIANPLDDVVHEALVADYAVLAKARGWVVPSTLADTGDLILFRFAGAAPRWNHIGLVVSPPNRQGLVETVEGNTGDPRQDQRDGDGVYRKTRSIHASFQTMFVRWDKDVRLPPIHLKLAA